MTVEKSWQGTGHIRSTWIKCHHHPALQRNDRGPVCLVTPGPTPETRGMAEAAAEAAAEVLKMIEISSTDGVRHTPCFTRQAPGVLQPPPGRSCCPAFLCPSLGTYPTHELLQGKPGRSSRLRRTCPKPACRRPRKPVLTGVPQGRMGRGLRSRGAPLSPWPTAGCWHIHMSTPW